jgi:hypothetical protein
MTMGAVIKFPRGISLRGRSARTPDAPAVVIILPVIRIERALDSPSPIKAAGSATKSATRSVAKPGARSVTKPAAKSAPARKRRKRVTAELPSPAYSG